MPTVLAPARFHLPGVGDFAGFDDRGRWNGFASPFLGESELRRLARALRGVPFAPTVGRVDGEWGWRWPGSTWIPAAFRLLDSGEVVWAVGAREWEWSVRPRASVTP